MPGSSSRTSAWEVADGRTQMEDEMMKDEDGRRDNTVADQQYSRIMFTLFMYTQQITTRIRWDASKLPLDYPPDDLGTLPGRGLKEYSSPNPARTLPVISCCHVPETAAGHHPNSQ